jgi:hypothetical protein
MFPPQSQFLGIPASQFLFQDCETTKAGVPISVQHTPLPNPDDRATASNDICAEWGEPLFYNSFYKKNTFPF